MRSLLLVALVVSLTACAREPANNSHSSDDTEATATTATATATATASTASAPSASAAVATVDTAASASASAALAKLCAEQHKKPYPEIGSSASDIQLRVVTQSLPRTSATASASPSAVGGGTVANVSQVVASMAAGFRRCFNQGLQCDEHMEGSLRVSTKIGPDGSIVAVAPYGAHGLSQGVIDCVLGVVTSKQFAPPDGGGATVVIPVLFTRAE
ncbi:MAG: AgmX/PglI C-terminal domain-containing protein [Polyangiaceae bacterium]